LILNCIHGPEKLKNSFAKTNTSVNTFVHLFNHLFDSNINLKKDEFAGENDLLKNIEDKQKIIK
jgi:hypothetical protein